MADNLTLRMFGYNVIPQEKKEYVHKKIKKAVEEIWVPVFDYLKKNEDVFSGDVRKEIESHNIQMLNLGMEMRKGETKHKFDTNV